MAIQTKTNAKNKQKTPMKMKGKKSFDNSRDDTGNGQMVKSPGGKTPKGKQSLGDRRVSFQIPGKNTPGKKQNGSFVRKKQLTPEDKGKVVLQEFQGRKTSGKRKDSDEKEDDDEEEDDDYDKEDDDDNDDDEEEEDDDDDEDDDEDDSNEEEKNMRTGAQNKTKTPVKAENTPLKTQNKKIQVEKNMKSEPQNTIDVKKNAERKLVRRREREKNCLFMKDLPLDVQKKELQALSSDILDVILPKARIPLEKRKNMFAFLRFANEAKAEENFKILQKKKLRNYDITLDFVGGKRKMHKPRKSTSHSPQKVGEEKKMQKTRNSTTHSPKNFANIYDTQKLKISVLPGDTTISQLADLFPRAYSIYMNLSKVSRYATMRFGTAEIAAEALQANQGAKISGKDISIEYSLIPRNLRVTKKRKYKSQRKGPAAKKVKVGHDGGNTCDHYY